MANTEHWHLDVQYLESDKAAADVCLLLNEWSFDKDQRMLSWRTKKGDAVWYVSSEILAGWKVYEGPEWCKQVPPAKPEDAFIRLNRLYVIQRSDTWSVDHATPHPDGWPGHGYDLQLGHRFHFVIPKDVDWKTLQELERVIRHPGVLDSFLMPKAWLRPGAEDDPLRRCTDCVHPAHLGVCLGLTDVGNFACQCSRRMIATT